MNKNTHSARRKTYYQLHYNSKNGFYKEKHLGYTITIDNNVYFITGEKVTHGESGLLVGNISEFNALIENEEGRRKILKAIETTNSSIERGNMPKLENVPIIEQGEI